MPLILPAILAGASLVGGLFNRGSEASAKGRRQENDQRILQDRNILDRSRIEQGGVLDKAALEQQGAFGEADLDLQRRGFQESAPNNRLDQAGRADFIQNLPGALSRGPSINTVGGRPFASFGMQARDFAPSQQTQDLAGLVRQRAFDAQSAGDQFDPLNLPQINLPDIPGLSEMKKPGKFERFAGIAGPILGGIGEAGSIFGDRLGSDTSHADRILSSQLEGASLLPPSRRSGVRF